MRKPTELQCPYGCVCVPYLEDDCHDAQTTFWQQRGCPQKPHQEVEDNDCNVDSRRAEQPVSTQVWPAFLGKVNEIPIHEEVPHELRQEERVVGKEWVSTCRDRL